MPLFKRKRFDSAPIFTVGDDSFIVKKAASGSTGDLLDIQNHAGTSLFTVNSSGVVTNISVAAGSIDLGTDTTGDYVQALNAGTGITLTNNTGEGAIPTVAIGQSIGTSDSPTFANLNLTGAIVIEGGTADTFETTLQVTDPTADRNVVFQDASGTVAILGTIALGTDTTGNYVSSLVAGTGVSLENNSGESATPTIAIGQSVGTSDSPTFSAVTASSFNVGSGVVFEGATADGFETTVQATDPTADRTVTLQDASGTVALLGTIALGTDTTGDYVSSLVAGTGVTLTNNSGETATPTIAIGQAVGTTDNVEFHDVTVTGDLTVTGTLNTVNETNLAVEDAFIYLNDGSTITNPDLGIAGNYNDGSYKHAGIFRDATDGTWKFFQDYTLEPGADINVSHASYADAPLKASKLTLSQATGTSPLTVSSTTKVDNLNADLLDGQEGSWYSPSGMISMFGGSSAPSGWLLCDGQAVSRTTYSALFSAIGTTYGSGDGSTTFNMPNLSGRVPVGLNASDASFDALGETGGHKETESHTHDGASHTHTGTTATEGAHNHTYSDYSQDGGAAVNFGTQYTVGGPVVTTRTTSAGSAHSHTFTADAPASVGTTGSFGGGNAGNLQPYIVLNYIIKI